MTDQNQTPDQQVTPQVPQEGAVLPENAAVAPESFAEQTTAVTPSVPTVAPPGVVPPPTDLIPPVTDLDQTQSDTSDFTLSDVTLTDSGGTSLMGWLRSHKPQRGSSAKFHARSASKRWRPRPWQWALIGIGAIVLVVAVLISTDTGLYYNKVHYGVQVAGQNVGGMSRGEATETLDGFAQEAQEQPIVLNSETGDETWSILPSEVGTSIDVPAAVSKAMDLTRRGNILADLGTRIELYFSGKDIPLEGTLDSAKMDALLAKISAKLDVPATNATLLVKDGSIEVVEGKQGKVVDKEALRGALTALLFTFHSTELPIPMLITSPDLSAVDITPALEKANVMISADLVITFKGKTVATLTPSQMVNYLDVAPGTGSDGSKTVPILSAAKMTEVFDALEPQVATPGVNATFDVNTETETITLVEGSDGTGLDRDGTAAALTQSAMNTADRTVEVALKPTPPDLTTEEVQAMGIKDLLGDYKTTPYVGSKNRQVNVRLATKLCSGVFLAPGEEFNTDQRLGVRDEAHGWASAPGIVGPGQLEDVLGGGICQVSTTLFNAALEAGLEITKRFNHSIYISHYPAGRDATVTAGGKNMCFRNDTPNYIFIYGWSSGINTHFYIFGVNDGRKVQGIAFSGFSLGGAFPTQKVIDTSLPVGKTKEEFEGQRSRSCSITRTIVYADGTTKSQTWSSRWRMLPKVVLTNPYPTTTTIKKPAGTTTTIKKPASTTTTVKKTTTTAATP